MCLQELLLNLNPYKHPLNYLRALQKHRGNFRDVTTKGRTTNGKRELTACLYVETILVYLFTLFYRASYDEGEKIKFTDKSVLNLKKCLESVVCRPTESVSKIAHWNTYQLLIGVGR